MARNRAEGRPVRDWECKEESARARVFPGGALLNGKERN